MIKLDQQEEHWRVTLNRPEKANSLTADMLAELIAIAQSAKATAKVFELRGAGKVFSAGADLDEAPQGLAVSPLWEELSSTIAELPCLTIAALNGTLAGGAFGMVLACDLRISVTNAKFFYPVMKLGFLPQPSDPKRLQALVGPARAKMILLAGQRVSAGEAFAWGLVDRVVEPEDLDASVKELAHDALLAESAHIVAMKKMFR